MPYRSRYQHADDIIAHLNTIIPSLMSTQPLLAAKYAGLTSVAAVTVYETAIKDIFFNFASETHTVLGCFVEARFKKLNGRITIDSIRDDYVNSFGHQYKDKFVSNLELATRDFLRSRRRDIRNSYKNLIVWRNLFAHQGELNSTTTYDEVVQAYEDGKEVIRCLAETMV